MVVFAAPRVSVRVILSLQQLAAASCTFSADDLDSENWEALAGEFLAAVETALEKLGCPRGGRVYRHEFSANYQALFPVDGKEFHTDLLRAALERCPVLYVNGEKFEFEAATLQVASNLDFVLAQVQTLLLSSTAASLSSKPVVEALSYALEAFDSAWASFEGQYVQQLMSVEEKARGLVARAAECACQLRECGLGNSEHQASLKELLSCLGKLNSVANVQGKGRDAFDVEVLNRAWLEWSRVGAGKGDAQSTTRALCGEILDSFSCMKGYLLAVSDRLETLDPHLSNNADLVERLADWEECYELGTSYVQCPGTLQSLCAWVSQIRGAAASSTSMASMLESCDAELFLVLPRLLLLSFLLDKSRHRDVVASLLPGNFSAAVKELTEAFSDVQNWSVAELLKHVVGGPGKYPAVSADSFLLVLERWSMELQRGNPREWNQMSHTAVKCATNSLRTGRSGAFVA